MAESSLNALQRVLLLRLYRLILTALRDPAALPVGLSQQLQSIVRQLGPTMMSDVRSMPLALIEKELEEDLQGISLMPEARRMLLRRQFEKRVRELEMRMEMQMKMQDLTHDVLRGLIRNVRG